MIWGANVRLIKGAYKEPPQIAFTQKREVIQRMLAALRKHARLVPGRLDLEVIAEDPDDDQVIIAAVEGSVDYIVSGDRHLRDLGAYQGIRIISPAEFARLLEAEPQS